MSQLRSVGGGLGRALPMPAGYMLLMRYAWLTVTFPSFPWAIITASSASDFEERRCVPTWTTRSLRRAASTMRRPSCTVIDRGFSTKTSLPKLHAAMV